MDFGNAGGPYLQWEIRYVHWQHDNGETKKRPALLISPSHINVNEPFLSSVKISTKQRTSRYRYFLSSQDAEFPMTGLKKPSYFYIDKVQRIHKSNILNRLGCLGSATGRQIDALIQRALSGS